MALPESPLTRGEQYLAKAAGQDVALPNVPLTRIEQYLAKIAGQDVAIPNVPLTRLEQYLAAIVENGGGGGATSMTDVTFSGTLAQPLSAAKYTTLKQQIDANKACAEINFDFQGTSVLAYLKYNPSAALLYSNGAQIGSTVAASMAFMLIWSINTGTASRAKAIMSGEVVDLMSMVSQIACTVTIHTLDASAYQ